MTCLKYVQCSICQILKYHTAFIRYYPCIMQRKKKNVVYEQLYYLRYKNTLIIKNKLFK